MFYRWYYPYNYRTGIFAQFAGVLVLLSLALIVVYYFLSPPVLRGQPEIRLWREDIGKTVRIPLEQYVAGVLAAEMPAQFELEALKAGAVAARTYALRRIMKGETIPDKEAHVSSDHRVSQAWLSPEALLELWGSREYIANWPKIKLAVTSTRGQVLVYQGEPIQALYHSTSGGVTANSEEYFSARVPYLRAVSSPWEEESPYWRTDVEIPYPLLVEKLSIDVFQNGSKLEPLPVSVICYPSGRTKSLKIGDQVIPSRVVREKLDLRSSWFTVSAGTQGLVFHLRGNGHGVGMSQYGANGLAEQGYKYDSILLYYYPGTRLVQAYR